MGKKVLIFGNSGSGKSTLARSLSNAENLTHLDLDSYAWLNTTPPQRAPLEDSFERIKQFLKANQSWVIEGCYTDLLELLSSNASEIIFLNLPIENCLKNAKSRPWEPHKYASKQKQDENLAMLLNWIAQYDQRDDVFSHAAHLTFYTDFAGKKTMINNKFEIST